MGRKGDDLVVSKLEDAQLGKIRKGVGNMGDLVVGHVQLLEIREGKGNVVRDAADLAVFQVEDGEGLGGRDKGNRGQEVLREGDV